jgi:hypothetical protein
MIGLLEDFAEAGGPEFFGYDDEDMKQAFDTAVWREERGTSAPSGRGERGGRMADVRRRNKPPSGMPEGGFCVSRA